MKKIVFFVQTRKPIGGSQILFLDFASYLSSNYPDYKIYYINFSNPVVEKLYGSSKINFCDIDSCDYSVFDDAIFFTPVNYIFYLMAKIKRVKNAKICLYFYHPQIFDWLNMQISNPSPNFTPFLTLLKEKKACCFMDSSNLIATNRLNNLSFSERYVPVSLHSNNNLCLPTIQPAQKNINVGWLGRLDYDKIYSLLNLMDNLMETNFNQTIRLHIIGDGNAKSLIRISKYCPKIQIVFNSYMYGDSRDKYINDNIDIMIAMGISALDSAYLGIPTLIPIVSGSPLRSNSYTYIFDAKGFSLGWDASDAKTLSFRSHPIERILDDIYVAQKKETFGAACYEYALNNFSLKTGVSLLLSALQDTNLVVQDCLSCKLISSQLNQYMFYKVLRHRKDFESFHLFNARLKRVRLEKTIKKKLKRIVLELKATIKKGKNK